MSAKRSRFKVAANIPVRRRPQANDGTKNTAEPSQDEENIQNLDAVIKQEPEISLVKKIEKKPGPSSIAVLPTPSSLPKSKEENVAKITPQAECNEPFVSKLTPDQANKVVASTCMPVSAPPSTPIKTNVRPRFARPAFTESASRRPSVHASSESEDENRRKNKVRRLSENVNGSLPISAPTPLPSMTSGTSGNDDGVECARLSFLPKKKAKVSNFIRKIAEARRDFKKKFSKNKPDRSNLKMFDLLFYNPQSAPLSSGKSSTDKKSLTDRNSAIEEEEVDDPDDDPGEESDAVMPVPQVMIGLDGEIILDQKSLVIETTAAKKSRKALENAVPILEEGRKKSSYYRRKNHANKKDWTPIETKCFYKALNCLGTDFALMEAIFTDRSRAELKNKFKREERHNGPLINKALGRPGFFNVQLLREEIDAERKKVEAERERQLNMKSKALQAAKEGKEASGEVKNKCIALLKRFVSQSSQPNEEKKERPRRQRRPTKRYFEDCTDQHVASESEEEKHVINDTDDINALFEPKGVSTEKKCERVENSNNPKDIQETDFVGILEKHISEGGKARVLIEPTTDEHVQVIFESHNKKPSQVFRVATSRKEVHSDTDDNLVIDETVNTSALLEHDYAIVSAAYDGTESETVFTFPSINQDGRGQCNYPNGDQCEEVRNEFDNYIMSNSGNENDNCKEMVYGTPAAGESSYISDTGTHYNCAAEYNYSSDIQVVHSSPDEPDAPYNHYNNSSDHVNDHGRNQTFCKEPCTDSARDFSSDRFDHLSRSDHSVEEPEAKYFQGDCEEVQSSREQDPLAINATVNYRSTAGLKYAIIESTSSADQKRTYLAGLEPGSFVFMSTDAPGMALERRCSMYMIAEKVLPDGRKEFVPMPVLLPPELMKLITDEVSSDTIASVSPNPI